MGEKGKGKRRERINDQNMREYGRVVDIRGVSQLQDGVAGGRTLVRDEDRAVVHSLGVVDEEVPAGEHLLVVRKFVEEKEGRHWNDEARVLCVCRDKRPAPLVNDEYCSSGGATDSLLNTPQMA